jgi:hypothetical protein
MHTLVVWADVVLIEIYEELHKFIIQLCYIFICEYTQIEHNIIRFVELLSPTSVA